MARLELSNISKSYGGSQVLHAVDLAVADGELVVLVGPSGCGKSTLLRMICGLEAITTGEMRIDGELVNDLPPARRGIAMVFQSYALYPHMTVAENMGFALKMAGVGRKERDEQVRRAADVLRIADLLGRMPKELSGGQRQRVAIGRAIVRKPRVFLFDEPLSNLDAALRVNMRIEQLGAPLSLYNAPANEFVAAFLGAPRINLVDAPGHDATPVHRALWSLLLPGAPAQASRAGVRAEHLRVDALGAGVPATVVMAEHLGDVSVLHLRVDGLAELLHAKVDASHAHLAAGASVGLVPVAGSVLAFDADGRRVE